MKISIGEIKTTTNLDILKEYFDNVDVNYKINMATNPNCSISILEKLSNDEYYFIRCNVAINSNCPINILEKLSNDKHLEVRHIVVTNPNCTYKFLKKIYPEFKEEVIKHPNWKLKDFE